MIYWANGNNHNIIFQMHTNIKDELIEDLDRRKAVMRHYLRSLSPTEKIVQLELLQKRTYSLAESRQQNGKGEIQGKLKIWRKAQGLN